MAITSRGIDRARKGQTRVGLALQWSGLCRKQESNQSHSKREQKAVCKTIQLYDQLTPSSAYPTDTSHRKAGQQRSDD